MHVPADYGCVRESCVQSKKQNLLPAGTVSISAL